MKKINCLKAGIIAALVLVAVGSVFAVKKGYAGKAATTNTAMASEIIESEATSEKVTSGEDETNPSTEIEIATAKKEMVANNNKIATETENEETKNEEIDNSLKTEHEEVVTSTVVEETIEENKASSITNINIESNGDKNIYTETVPVIKETETKTETNVIVEEIPVTPSYSIISASTTKTTDTVSSSVYEEPAPDVETETTTETETKTETETETETVTDMNNVSVNGNISVDFDLF